MLCILPVPSDRTKEALGKKKKDSALRFTRLQSVPGMLKKLKMNSHPAMTTFSVFSLTIEGCKIGSRPPTENVKGEGAF